MLSRKVGLFAMVGLILAGPLTASARVDKESIFQGARYPASILDLQLSHIQRQWLQHYVTSPPAELKKKFHLIVTTGMAIELDYWGGGSHSCYWNYNKT